MNVEHLQPGDLVYCAQAIYNDGSFPDCDDNALLIEAGRRGVVVNIGYLEEQPSKQVFLVRFEQPGTNSPGPEIGCWAEDLSIGEN